MRTNVKYLVIYRHKDNQFRANGVSRPSTKGNTVYMWNKIWHPIDGKMGLGGFLTEPVKISFADGTPIDFEKKGDRIILYNLPDENPDKILGMPIIKIEFDRFPEYRFASYLPQLNHGMSREI